jgi:hypothetical protein
MNPEEEIKNELDLILGEASGDLLDILDMQMALLATVAECEFGDLYDTIQEDKIKCVADCFRVISSTQRALLKEIKKLT